jgi:hypothetical protein
LIDGFSERPILEPLLRYAPEDLAAARALRRCERDGAHEGSDRLLEHRARARGRVEDRLSWLEAAKPLRALASERTIGSSAWRSHRDVSKRDGGDDDAKTDGSGDDAGSCTDFVSRRVPLLV